MQREGTECQGLRSYMLLAVRGCVWFLGEGTAFGDTEKTVNSVWSYVPFLKKECDTCATRSLEAGSRI